MSEWIDFAVYSTLIVLFFVFLPRASRHYTAPTIADRNPEWVADHRDVVARLEHGGWFLHACYVWAAIAVAALLGVMLELIGPPFGAAPKWEVLKDLHAAFLIGGGLLWGVCALLLFRWLATHVPLTETRRATLKPRVASDYLAPTWRIAIETLTVLHLGTWVVIGLWVGGGGARYWSGFVLMVVLTVLLAIVAAAVPRRRAGFADRMFGEGLRRFELRAACLFRLVPLISGGMLISHQVYDLDPARAGHLLLVSLFITILVQFLRLRPVAPRAPRLDVESRLSA